MAWTLSVTLIDAYNRKATKRYQMQAAAYADAATDRTAVIAALNAVTNMGVVSHTLSEKTAVGDSAAAGTNRDEGITLSVMKADTERATLKVPGPDKTALIDNDVLDKTDAAWVAYFNLFAAGNELYLSDGENALTFLSGQLDK